MKLFILFSFLSGAIVSVSHAQNTPQLMRGGHHGLKQTLQSSAGKNELSIHGVCNVVASPSNPIGGPCVSLLLLLTDSDGKEVSKGRTTAQGAFDFSTEAGKDYKILPGSKFYELATPATTVHGGGRVGVQLKQI